jgi:ACS family D-galactonate transporter-like MFS transporter
MEQQIESKTNSLPETATKAVVGKPGRTNIRWLVATLMWLAIAINYTDRTVLSAAAPYLIKELHIPVAQMGLLLSAFFWSYSLLQIPAGWLSDRFGQKIGLGGSVGLWSLATGAMGLATGFRSFLSLRIALGVGEAGAYPSNAGIASKWFPDRERATISAIFDSAGKFGGAVGMPLVVWMISLMGWRMCFAALGAVGIAWSVAWWLFFSETPDKHKMVSAEEVRYIYEGQRLRHGASGPAPMRWYELLRYRNIWAMCLGFFTINYISYFFITWLPTYLVKEKGMGMMAMGFVASLPLLAGMLAEVVAGILSDRVAHSKRISLTATRKIFLIAGLTMALCIGIAPFSHSLVFTVALLCIAKAGTTTAASQVWALPGDVSPRNMTSTVAGLQNMVSNFGGVVGPIVTGLIVSTTGSFNAALMFSGLIGLVGILIYSFLLTTVEPITC